MTSEAKDDYLLHRTTSPSDASWTIQPGAGHFRMPIQIVLTVCMRPGSSSQGSSSSRPRTPAAASSGQLAYALSRRYQSRSLHGMEGIIPSMWTASSRLKLLETVGGLAFESRRRRLPSATLNCDGRKDERDKSIALENGLGRCCLVRRYCCDPGTALNHWWY